MPQNHTAAGTAKLYQKAELLCRDTVPASGADLTFATRSAASS